MVENKKIIKRVQKTRRKPREHPRRTFTRRDGTKVKGTTVNKGVRYKPKNKTKPKSKSPVKKSVKKQQIKKGPFKNVAEQLQQKSKEEFNALLHEQIMQNNKELRETVKKINMVEKDEDRLQEKLNKIEENIIDNEDWIKKVSTPEGKEAYYKSRADMKHMTSGTLFTKKEIEEMRKEGIEATKKEIELADKKALPIKEKIIERKKQTNVLQGKRNGLKLHLAYLQSYQSSVNKAKGDWRWKAEGQSFELADFNLF